VIPFQRRVVNWAVECFAQPLATENRCERYQRFYEEATELAQLELSREQAHAIVDWKYDRPPGVVEDEVGGTLITLALLCSHHGFNMMTVGEIILQNCWLRIEKIREKQKTKPSF
jgi:hypothetical protein